MIMFGLIEGSSSPAMSPPCSRRGSKYEEAEQQKQTQQTEQASEAEQTGTVPQERSHQERLQRQEGNRGLPRL